MVRFIAVLLSEWGLKQHKAEIGDGFGAIIIGKAGFAGQIHDHDAVALHRREYLVGITAGGIRVGALVADDTALCREHQRAWIMGSEKPGGFCRGGLVDHACPVPASGVVLAL